MTVSIHCISLCSNVLLTKPWQKEIKRLVTKIPQTFTSTIMPCLWVLCTIYRSDSTAFFSGHCLEYFSACVWQDLSFAHQKSEKTTYIDNLVFSALSVLWGTVKNFRLKSDRHHTLPGELSGSLRQNSPHKDAFSASA